MTYELSDRQKARAVVANPAHCAKQLQMLADQFAFELDHGSDAARTAESLDCLRMQMAMLEHAIAAKA